MPEKLSPKTPGQVINDLTPGAFAKLGKVSPAGSLEARRLAAGVALYWRVTINGKTERTPIGAYDSSAPPLSLKPTNKGYSISAAIRAAESLAQKHRDNLAIGGYRGLVDAEAESVRIAAQAQEQTLRAAEAATLAAAQYTLKNLLVHYCDYLEGLGRRSHSDARSIFQLHVVDAWPHIAMLPANTVTGEQIADMMRKVIENGKARTANKLRSYIRAAYQVALAARSKASIPLHFKAYNVRSNPGADTVPDESANKADKNPLSADELRAYWQVIKPMPGFIGAVLRLHLLTGGQRIEQLCCLLTANVASDTITLFDGKGRPGKAPRPHTVPLIPAAAAALSECNPKGAYAISTDGGKTHLSAITLSHWAVAAASDMQGFQTKRIRSGVETLLASKRISSDIRGRLQSHGIAGVQARHYDGHDYLDEKRHALETMFNLLEGKPVKAGKVVRLKAA
ncbi:MAG: integrase [Rhodoferax sp.]|uniref:integrase n=1 Tax=Rhodoferax sp. TaxID=50421 RepID=UPI00260B42DA|nr:integrase [Rhodoferax sp.]MDD2879254.1 integrase [Rhodoferax sp.]